MALEIIHFREGDTPEILLDGEQVVLPEEQLVLLELLVSWPKSNGRLTYDRAVLLVKGDGPNANGAFSSCLSDLRGSISDAPGGGKYIRTASSRPHALSVTTDVKSDLREAVDAAD